MTTNKFKMHEEASSGSSSTTVQFLKKTGQGTDRRNSEAFEKFIAAIKNKYTTLLKVHVKGEHSVQFQQAWLCHIEEYFRPSLHYTQN